MAEVIDIDVELGRMKRLSDIDSGQWHRYIVEGRGEFPFDMLRRECAFPARTEDALALTARGKRRIELITTEGRFAGHSPRWKSFGWEVVDGYNEWGPTQLAA